MTKDFASHVELSDLAAAVGRRKKESRKLAEGWSYPGYSCDAMSALTWVGIVVGVVLLVGFLVVAFTDWGPEVPDWLRDLVAALALAIRDAGRGRLTACGQRAIQAGFRERTRRWATSSRSSNSPGGCSA